MTQTWQAGLLGSVDGLGPWFRGRVVPEADASDTVVPAKSYLEIDFLRDAVVRTTATPPRADESGQDDGPAEATLDETQLGAAVSRFTRHYTASLTAAALAGLSNGVGVDLAIGHCAIIERNNIPMTLVLDGLPALDGGPTGATGDELRRHAWRKLYAEHLAPLFDAMGEVAKGGTRLAWTNATEWVVYVMDAAEINLDATAAKPIRDECKTLLAAERLPGLDDRANPLHDRMEWPAGDGNGFPEVVPTRKLCCLSYLISDRSARLCATCPHLPLEDRISLLRERHGVSTGAPEGAAEKRSIEVGMNRPSFRRAADRRNS